MAPVTKIVGTKTTLWVQAALNDIDLCIATPPGDHLRYDFAILLPDGSYRRVQAKHARINKDSNTPNSAIVFKVASCHSNNSERKSVSNDYRGDAEFFGVYSEYTNKAYLIPVAEMGTKNGSLRLLPPVNNQKKKIRYASTYEITRKNASFIQEMLLTTKFTTGGDVAPTDQPDEEVYIELASDIDS